MSDVVNQTPRPGPLDGAARILRELLRTPEVRESVRVVLREFDPENAPELVRTLVREDPELFLALAASLPALANAALGIAGELARTIEQYPAGLVPPLLASVAGELDADAARELGGRVALAARAGLAHLNERAAAGDPTLRATVAAVADHIRETARAHPAVVREVVAPVAAALADALHAEVEHD